MFGLFKSDPARKLNEQYRALLQQAMQAQRSGNIKLYAELSDKAEVVGKKLEEFQQR